jgi:hypothetical protein
MDVIYAESIVVASLRETLCELTQDTFITRTVADCIFYLGCWVRIIFIRVLCNYNFHFFTGFMSRVNS